MCQARHTPERAPNHHRASSHARASANAGLVPYVATHLPFATSESDDAGGLNTAVTVARDALLLLWHGYADRRRGDRPAPRFEVARGPGAETLTALPLATSAFLDLVEPLVVANVGQDYRDFANAGKAHIDGARPATRPP